MGRNSLARKKSDIAFHESKWLFCYYYVLRNTLQATMHLKNWQHFMSLRRLISYYNLRKDWLHQNMNAHIKSYLNTIDAIPSNSTLTSSTAAQYHHHPTCFGISILENPLPYWVPHLPLIWFQHLLLPLTVNNCILYIRLLPLALLPVTICQ